MSDKTIEDVAHIVGCSVGTVSRAINNRKGVSEKTRQHILQTMKEIGYRPNALAQNLLRQRTQRRHAPTTMWPNKQTPLPTRLSPEPQPKSQQRQMRHVAFANATNDPRTLFHMHRIQRTAFHRLQEPQSLQRLFPLQSHAGNMPQHMQSTRYTVGVAQESAFSTLL